MERGDQARGFASECNASQLRFTLGLHPLSSLEMLRTIAKDLITRAPALTSQFLHFDG